MTFDGTDDYVAITGEAFGTDPFTIIMRVNPTNGYGDRGIIGADHYDAMALVQHTDYRARMVIENGTGSGVVSLQMTPGTVNMLAVVRNGDTIRFFVNGSFENETFASQNFTATTDRLGAVQTGYSDFVGTLRDVAWFSDAKSDAYITAFYNGGSFTEYEDGDPL